MNTGIVKIRGNFPECKVTVNDKVLDIKESHAVWYKSEEFAWGYLGSGPAQLALAILMEFVRPEIALVWFQYFKEAFLAKPKSEQDLVLDIDIGAWLDEIAERER